MNAVKKLLTLTLPTLVLLFVAGELIFRFVLPAAESPTVAFDAADGILKYDVTGRRSGIYTIGPFVEAKARWRINNDGWNSEIDYTSAHGAVPRIAIIGDSYVEAMQVDVDKSFGALLRRAFAGRAEVYTIGIAGAPLSEYLQLARYAARRFHPDVFVINVVHNDFDESIRTLVPRPEFLQFEPAGNSVREAPPLGYTPSRMRRLLRRSAVFRWLLQNAQLYALPTRLAAIRDRKTMIANTDLGKILANRTVIELAVREVARKLRAENPNARIVFMIDGARSDIYNGTAATSPVRMLAEMVRRAAEAAHCDFLDLTPAFAAEWARSHREFNFRYNFHWNEEGHRVAAAALARTLNSETAPR